MSSCSILKKLFGPTQTSNNLPISDYIGIKITLLDDTFENSVDEYYYVNGEKTPYIHDIVVLDNYDFDVHHVKHLIDVYTSKKFNCYKIATLIKENNIIKTLDSSDSSCSNVDGRDLISYRTITYDYVSNNRKERITFNVTILIVPELIKYTLIEYDQNHNKIVSNTYDISNLPTEYTLNSNTAYCRIIHEYKQLTETQVIEKIVDRNQIAEGYSDYVYNLIKDNERKFYEIKLII